MRRRRPNYSAANGAGAGFCAPVTRTCVGGYIRLMGHVPPDFPIGQIQTEATGTTNSVIKSTVARTPSA